MRPRPTLRDHSRRTLRRVAALRSPSAPGSPRPEGAVARRMAAAAAPFCATAVRHADGRRRRRGRRGNPRGDDRRRALEPRLCQQRRRHRAASGARRRLHDRHGRASGRARPVRPGARSEARDRVRGVATSGWRGRSFSLGIADAVTVLAPSASLADAAATLIANASICPAIPPSRARRRARSIRRAISATVS